MDLEQKCEAVLKWAEDFPKFNTSTVEGILDWISEHESTSYQEEAIDNIISGFKIDVEKFI